ncbi:MAG: hypothetical protein GXO64_04670 [Candidatus Micrarchaeota archaeon]|nr:hypothetical protein [Candidatus Micrarchaeota archaeon]
MGDPKCNHPFGDGVFILLVSLFVLLLVASSAAAFSVLGIGSIPTTRENLHNYRNWPVDVKRMCTAEQSRVVLLCSRKGYENWVVYQTIQGKGTVHGRDMNLLYKGRIIGNYECDPPQLREQNGYLVDDWFGSASGLISSDVRDNTGAVSASFYCHFMCGAWNCAEGKTTEERLAEEWEIDKKNIICDRFLFEESQPTWEYDYEKEDKERLENEMNEKEESYKQACKMMGEECVFFRIHSSYTKLKEPPYKGLAEICWYCSCIDMSTPKTSLRKNDMKRAKRLYEKFKFSLLMKDLKSLRDRFSTHAEGHVPEHTKPKTSKPKLSFLSPAIGSKIFR